jgi:hypothetical protein
MKSSVLLFTLGAMLGNSAIAEEKAPSSYTPAQLLDRSLERRAVEAVIWGMPAVNFDVMFQAMVRDAKAGESSNKIVYWSRLFDWKNQTLTPNPDAVYFMPFFDTKEAGPMVLELPPSGDEGVIVGSIMDCWQNALEDMGPAGVDKGKGGKCLILPPGYKEPVPDGYFVMPSDTYAGYALVRSNPKSGSEVDVAKAVAYGRQMKLYPLSKAAQPPETTYVDAIDVVYEANIPYDLRYFESLNRIVQAQPWLDRDKAMVDALKTIGIEKGKPFQPDARTQGILKAAVAEAHAWLVHKYETSYFPPPFYEGSHWHVPASPEVVEGMPIFFSKPGTYPVDSRGTAYTLGFFSSKRLGAGQFYLMGFQDKAGEDMSGRHNYRLNVPSGVPVNQYWSATAYDRATHGLIRQTQWSSRSSNTPGLQKNADGSVDIYFSPKAPEGKETNWVPTDAKGKFEVLFRLYGPEKPFFEKTWKLPDIEKVM